MKTIKPDIHGGLTTIGKTFKVLDDRERLILRLRFGLEDGIPKTLAEVAKIEKVTRERIRQLEARAFEKIEVVLKYEE